ncbi:MAG: CvpA family protein [Spirochaetaceae bacterium]|nr:CvpA family protein [Spirochaetaceae bacterium]
MAVIDIICIALIALLAIRGALIGFIENALSKASVILGACAALLLYKNGAAFIRTKILSEAKLLPECAAFVIIFGIVFLVVKLVQSWLKDIAERGRLKSADHFLGSLFGIIEGITVVAVMIFILNIQPLFDAQVLLSESIVAQYLLPLIGKLPATVPLPSSF